MAGPGLSQVSDQFIVQQQLQSDDVSGPSNGLDNMENVGAQEMIGVNGAQSASLKSSDLRFEFDIDTIDNEMAALQAC